MLFTQKDKDLSRHLFGKTLENGYAINAVLSKKELSIKAEKLIQTFGPRELAQPQSLKLLSMRRKTLE